MNKEKLKKEVKKLSLLEYNWDGYGAEPIKQEIIDRVNDIINYLDDRIIDPHIIPANDGIGLEWNNNKESLIIHIGNNITYSYISKKEEENNSYGTIFDHNEINELLKKYGE